MPTAVGSKVQSKKTFLTALLAMIAGITKDLTAKMAISVGGVSMTQTAILAKLNAIKTLFDNITIAKNGLTTAVAAKNAGAQDAKQFMADLKKAVESQFGSHSPLLPDFGIALPKPKSKPTVAQMAVAKGLSTQTRKARGTKGKKQKLEVTVQGRPGIVVVGPTGQPLVGVDKGGPIAPAQVPVDTAGGSGAGSQNAPALAGNGGSPASGSPVAAATHPNGTATGGANAS